MKQKYKFINKKKTLVCGYRKCQQAADKRWYVIADIRLCTKHKERFYSVKKIEIRENWFTKLVSEIASFIEFIFRR